MCRSAWRFALLGLTLVLPACQTLVGDPTDGAGGFLADTHTFHTNPNKPVGDAPNLLRAEGKDAGQEPLVPEEGNVWPGPATPEPTLQDIEREMRQSDQQTTEPPVRQSQVAPVPQSQQPSPSRLYPIPGGAVGTQTGNGVQTYTDPKGGTGVVVPNGNGTSTLVGADGSITTVPDRK